MNQTFFFCLSSSFEELELTSSGCDEEDSSSLSAPRFSWVKPRFLSKILWVYVIFFSSKRLPNSVIDSDIIYDGSLC